MTLERIEALPYELGLGSGLRPSGRAVAGRRGFLLRARDRSGVFGLGDAAPLPLGAAADPEPLGRAIDALVGRSLEEALALRVAPRIPAWVAAGIETALLDLRARRDGVPLSDLLGGACRRAVPVNALLAGGDAAALAVAASEADALGFAVVKIKAGATAEETLERAEAVRRARPGLGLRVDANGAWEPAEAEAICRALAELGVASVEQPLAPGRVEKTARLRRRAGLAFALDEDVATPTDVERIAALAAADAVVLKLARVGGPRRALACAAAAARLGLEVVVTTGLETEVGLAAALHVALACPGRLGACGLATAGLVEGSPLEAGIAAGPWMEAPPGAGLAIDARALTAGSESGA